MTHVDVQNRLSSDLDEEKAESQNFYPQDVFLPAI